MSIDEIRERLEQRKSDFPKEENPECQSKLLTT